MAKSYVTKSMDTWDAISKLHYGSEYYMHKIIEANPAYINVVFFSAGVTLIIPDIDTTADSSVVLPPWKR